MTTNTGHMIAIDPASDVESQTGFTVIGYNLETASPEEARALALSMGFSPEFVDSYLKDRTVLKPKEHP